MIMTMTKYHENLLRDSPLPWLSMVKFFTSLEIKMFLKIPNKTFFRITRICKEKSINAYVRFGYVVDSRKFSFPLSCEHDHHCQIRQTVHDRKKLRFPERKKWFGARSQVKTKFGAVREYFLLYRLFWMA